MDTNLKIMDMIRSTGHGDMNSFDKKIASYMQEYQKQGYTDDEIVFENSVSLGTNNDRLQIGTKVKTQHSQEYASVMFDLDNMITRYNSKEENLRWEQIIALAHQIRDGQTIKAIDEEMERPSQVPPESEEEDNFRKAAQWIKDYGSEHARLLLRYGFNYGEQASIEYATARAEKFGMHLITHSMYQDLHVALDTDSPTLDVLKEFDRLLPLTPEGSLRVEYMDDGDQIIWMITMTIDAFGIEQYGCKQVK